MLKLSQLPALRRTERAGMKHDQFQFVRLPTFQCVPKDGNIARQCPATTEQHDHCKSDCQSSPAEQGMDHGFVIVSSKLSNARQTITHGTVSWALWPVS